MWFATVRSNRVQEDRQQASHFWYHHPHPKKALADSVINTTCQLHLQTSKCVKEKVVRAALWLAACYSDLRHADMWLLQGFEQGGPSKSTLQISIKYSLLHSVPRRTALAFLEDPQHSKETTFQAKETSNKLLCSMPEIQREYRRTDTSMPSLQPTQ
jgi:hypothetical protein